MLVGAFSSNAYSFPRATNDADIVVEYRAGMFDSLFSATWRRIPFGVASHVRSHHGHAAQYDGYLPTNFEIEFFRLGQIRMICRDSRVAVICCFRS